MNRNYVDLKVAKHVGGCICDTVTKLWDFIARNMEKGEIRQKFRLPKVITANNDIPVDFFSKCCII